MRMTMLLAFTLVTSAAYAQTDAQAPASTPPPQTQPKFEIDVRWAPWLGCWRAEDDFSATGTRLCITPETITGVKMQNIVENVARTTETVIPDKVTRPVNDDSCRGTSRSEWSQNKQRLFRFTDVTCATEPPRKLAGVAFLLEGPILVDVQLADLSDNKSVRVRRFVRSGNQKLPDGTFAPRSSDVRGSAFGAPWTVDDVIEASGKLPADAVQAAISEANSGFRLDKTGLVAMDKAGVSPDVIDLMVALSYPKRFVVERATGPSSDAGFGDAFGWWDPFLSPMMPFSMMGRDCYSAYAYGPSYRCGAYYGYGSMFGYLNPYSAYGYGGPYNGGWVVVDSGSSSIPPIVDTGNTGSAGGRVVNGRGYTQIRNREPVPVPSNGTAGYTGDTSSGSNTSGTNSTGSSGVSSGGYSGGGGGSSGGGERTAVPRPPGGGL